ncbi:MAG TPA: hypothetical protein DCE41_33855 [Cytophagales bacterium]|nr:hypothetical protein [Cytophagales bacterium]HAA17980.1 hypothetical protein [Cytophagales bacterium]HAP64725.1 hypothetical protein [Cytophagales bacterium]
MQSLRTLTLIFLIGIIVCGCAPHRKIEKPVPQSGTLDLRGFDLGLVPYLMLEGEWSFYPEGLYSPAELSIQKSTLLEVPQPWNTLEGLVREGSSTYSLRLLLDESQLGTPLVLKMRTVYLAYSLFLDGEKVVQVGDPSRSSFTPLVKPNLIEFTPTSTEVEVVVQVSNYRFFKGGIVETPQLGLATVMHSQYEKNVGIEVILVGSLLMVGIYHFIIFLLLNSNRSALFFSLICIVLAGRFAYTGEHYFNQVFPNLSAWITLRIEYGSLYIGPYLILLFFNSLYPQELPRWILKVMIVPTILLGLVLLVPNSHWFSILLPLGQLVMLLSGLTVIAYTLPMAIYRKRKSAWLFTIAFLCLFGTAINDFLYVVNVVDTGFIILYGMLLFTFVQAVALAVRFGFTFQQLNILRLDLEEKVEKRTKDITLRNQELEQQKEELTAQTEEMTANLEYARRIQEASLDSVDYIQSLFPEAFVLYFPRDYVSGDFYWFGEQEGKKVVIGGDCTGHGVPGAFMTALGQAALDHIILGEGVIDPGEILSRLEERVKASMQTQVDGKWLPDGMDIGVLVFDEEAGSLAFEGAKIDLVFIRNHEITRVRGSKFPIGRSTGYGHKTFKTSYHKFKKGDRFYVYSDGYRDQFGGPEGRKFNAKPFRELLEQTAGGSLASQYRELSQSFEDWKGSHPQTDDILVLGLEV